MWVAGFSPQVDSKSHNADCTLALPPRTEKVLMPTQQSWQVTSGELLTGRKHGDRTGKIYEVTSHLTGEGWLQVQRKCLTCGPKPVLGLFSCTQYQFKSLELKPMMIHLIVLYPRRRIAMSLSHSQASCVTLAVSVYNGAKKFLSSMPVLLYLYEISLDP